MPSSNALVLEVFKQDSQLLMCLTRQDDQVDSRAKRQYRPGRAQSYQSSQMDDQRAEERGAEHCQNGDLPDALAQKE